MSKPTQPKPSTDKKEMEMPSYSYTGSLRGIRTPKLKCSFLKKRMGCKCSACGGH